jgi:aminoglycoside phosphotransferase (APT) family kinase protein
MRQVERTTRESADPMSTGQMQPDEIHIDESLVRRLVAAQFPRWADLPIEPVPSAGTDNAIYRLGAEMAVRLPRIHWAVGLVDKEQQWLPKLAPHLPLAIPVPIARGNPAVGFPWPWSVCRWLEGENATVDRISDLREAATDLARFIAALQRIDPTGGPPAGPQNFFRGVPLADRDPDVRAAIAALGGTLDTDAVTAAWEAALQAPAWDGPPVWIHGDLMSGNLLVVRGRLSAVIDFGCLGVGDPAADLSVAWNLFSGESREAFRAALGVDDATWARGRGWALRSMGALIHYKDTNPVLAGIARRAVDEVLADHQSGSFSFV